MKELAIVIPVYNEQDSIAEVIKEWSSKGDLILINDGSTDQTRAIIENQSIPLTLINQQNQGHGQSCINGYQYAIEQGFEWIFQTDSDGQTKADDFDNLWLKRSTHSVLFGRRVNRQDGLHRKIISFTLRMIMFFLLGKYLKDPNVPFRLMKAAILKQALVSLPKNLFLANAYLALELAKRTKIFWHPITFAPRAGGTPSINFLGFLKVGLKVFKEFLSIDRSSNFSLESITLWYLTIPFILFLIGWLHLWFSLPLVCLILYLLYKYKQNINLPFSLPLVASFILIAIWLYYSGVGGLSYQNGDYQKHNAMLFDLITQPWPVGYTSPGTTYQLVYYFGHYLVPALVGKIFGVNIAHIFFYFWTLLGVWLALLWFFKFVGKRSLLLTLLFISFSGIDIIGQLIIDSNLLNSTTVHIEWWSGYKYWQYSANTSLLYWVPQHAIAGWLITSLLISSRIPLLFIFALSSLWSPFVMLGLIPFLAIKLNYKKILRWENGLGLLLLCLVGLFYQSGLMHHRSYFLWTGSNISEWVPILLLFYLLEFGFFTIFIFKNSIRDNKNIFLTMLVTLFLIPFYIFGHYNDFAMRASIPALFILQLFITKYLLTKTKMSKVLIIILLLGFPTAFFEINRSLHNPPRGFTKYRHIPQIQPFVAAQYMGRKDSFFFKYLARKAPANVVIPPKVKIWLRN